LELGTDENPSKKTMMAKQLFLLFLAFALRVGAQIELEQVELNPLPLIVGGMDAAAVSGTLFGG
jgi:hypothetical protein